MKPGTDYPTNTAVAILLIGEAGSGKSNWCMEFPDPWFLDVDMNLKNAIERHPGKKFFYDRVDVDDTGKTIPVEQRWPRCEALMKAACANPAVKTIVADSLTRMCFYLQEYLVVQPNVEKPIIMGNMKCMAQSHWLPFAKALTKFIFDARESNKPFIMTCHIKVDDSELIPTLKEQRVLVSGQIQSSIAGMFTDFIMTQAEPSSDKARWPTGVRYFLRTAPTARIRVKNSMGLPADCDVDGPELKAALAKIAGAV